MKKYLDIVEDFSINNSFIIKCKKYNLMLPIKNGTVDINITNEYKERIGINEININDKIIIFYKEYNKDFDKIYIKPIKIIKQFNYVFNETSSCDSSCSSDVNQ
jgi:hypothetical protein